MKTKICNQCKEEKDIYFFDKVSKNGHRNTCRKCRNKKNTSSYLSKEGNIEKRREYNREYQIEHRKNNPYHQLYCKCLWDIKSSIKGIKNNKKWSNKQRELKYHLENLFTPEMNWDNYGSYWEVDHIVSATKMAKAGYKLEDINKLSNLRPLKAEDNRSERKENKKQSAEPSEPSVEQINKQKEYQKKYREENKEKISKHRNLNSKKIKKFNKKYFKK